MLARLQNTMRKVLHAITALHLECHFGLLDASQELRIKYLRPKSFPHGCLTKRRLLEHYLNARVVTRSLCAHSHHRPLDLIAVRHRVLLAQARRWFAGGERHHHVIVAAIGN